MRPVLSSGARATWLTAAVALFVAPTDAQGQPGSAVPIEVTASTRIAELANTALSGGLRLRVFRGRPLAQGEFELRPPVPGMDCIIDYENMITCRRAFIEDNEADEAYQDLLDLVRDVLPEWIERDLPDTDTLLDRVEFTRGGVSFRVFATEPRRGTTIWFTIRPL